MRLRPLLLAAALLASVSAVRAEDPAPALRAAPVLRANVAVAGDLVRIGDVIENAGPAARIPIYRAPDPGTTGTVKVSDVVTALRAHDVIAVDTNGLREISVTRLARTLERKDIELQITTALEHRGGLGDAANLSLTFDQDVQTLQLDPANNGPMQVLTSRYDPRGGRFDVTFGITNENGTPPLRLRFTGTVVETVDAAILMRGVERGEIIKSSDVVIERRPKSEVGSDGIGRDQAIGMQARHSLRNGQPLHIADLVRPDLVQRDQGVMLIYQTAGIYLTVRGKALDSGSEGDTVSVLNMQSKRTVTGVVSGRGQVTVATIAPRLPIAAPMKRAEAPAPVSVATNDTTGQSR